MKEAPQDIVKIVTKTHQDTMTTEIRNTLEAITKIGEADLITARMTVETTDETTDETTVGTTVGTTVITIDEMTDETTEETTVLTIVEMTETED